MSPAQVDTTMAAHQQYHHGTAPPPPQYTAHAGTTTSMKIDPTDVGCQFVQQYYTVLNQDPKRLHCFYKKNSLFTHGLEGDFGLPAVGQTEIHNRIVGLDLVNCKVAIINLDCQASLNGGIVILVTGQLFNKNMPPRKFSQTFFLAEQPNGYYVLNDIFRFHKESQDMEDYNNMGLQEATHDDIAAATTTMEETRRVKEVVGPSSSASAETTLETGTTATLPPSHSVKEGAEMKKEDRKQQAKSSLPKQPTSNKDIVTPAAATVVASSKPKTWATLAAVGKEQWGENVSQVTGTSVVVEESPLTKQEVRAEKKPIEKSGGRRDTDIASTIFVKHVTEEVTEEALRSALRAFGRVKSVRIVASKNNAFVEFDSPQAAKKAVHAKKLKVNEVDLVIEEKQPPRQHAVGGSTATMNDPSTTRTRHERHERPGNHHPVERQQGERPSHSKSDKKPSI